MPAASPSSCRRSSSASWSIAACPRPAARAGAKWRARPAAHSTVTFNDRSSCRFMASRTFKRLLLGTPIVAGPRHIDTAREERDDGLMLHASHDGYAGQFGVIHQRSLLLAADGSRLEGEDLFNPSRGDALPTKAPDAFAVRFHLHPSVKANLAERRPWRHADDAQPGGVELQRLRRSRRARGKRLSCRSPTDRGARCRS